MQFVVLLIVWKKYKNLWASRIDSVKCDIFFEDKDLNRNFIDIIISIKVKKKIEVLIEFFLLNWNSCFFNKV